MAEVEEEESLSEGSMSNDTFDKGQLHLNLEITRQLILEQMEGSKAKSAAEQIELEWDLWLINGIMQYGIAIRSLLTAKENMQKTGEKPTNYDLVPGFIP